VPVVAELKAIRIGRGAAFLRHERVSACEAGVSRNKAFENAGATRREGCACSRICAATEAKSGPDKSAERSVRRALETGAINAVLHPAPIPASMSLHESPIIQQDVRSRAYSAAACSNIPGSGFRHGQFRAAECGQTKILVIVAPLCESFCQHAAMKVINVFEADFAERYTSLICDDENREAHAGEGGNGINCCGQKANAFPPRDIFAFGRFLDDHAVAILNSRRYDRLDQVD
jgi:hypothetical protein